jgi:FAD:protein FMN transferase
MRRVVRGATLLSAVLCGVGGCRREAGPREEGFLTMGTYASVMAGQGEEVRVAEYTAVARGVMQRIDADMSLYKTNSVLCKVNANAGIAPVPVGDELRAVLRLAREYGELSGGAFDVTAGPLVRLWGFSGGKTPAAPPAAAQIKAAGERVNYRRIALSETGAFLEQTGMVIDLGGIAKGFAVDRCCDELRKLNAANFTVNLGGNMRCFGRAAPGRAWKVGVRNPFNGQAVLGTLHLTDGLSVSTSGNYERFVTINGKRYAHIIDPRTGHPVEGMAGVTVLAPTAVAADALSTALFVLGMEGGRKVLRGSPDTEALFVPDRQPLEVWVTPGFARDFEPAPDLAPRVHILAR